MFLQETRMHPYSSLETLEQSQERQSTYVAPVPPGRAQSECSATPRSRSPRSFLTRHISSLRSRRLQAPVRAAAPSHRLRATVSPSG